MDIFNQWCSVDVPQDLVLGTLLFVMDEIVGGLVSKFAEGHTISVVNGKEV